MLILDSSHQAARSGLPRRACGRFPRPPHGRSSSGSDRRLRSTGKYAGEETCEITANAHGGIEAGGNKYLAQRRGGNRICMRQDATAPRGPA